MRQRGREGLHVEAVANLRLLGRADVFHDVTNLASAFKRDGQAPVLIDQEGGRVARMRPPHWRAYPPALELAGRQDAARAIYVNARMIAEELRLVGITTD